MKSILVFASGLLFSFSVSAAEKTISTTVPATATTITSTASSAVLPNTLAFNFVAMSQGKNNIYFDVGGLSERVAPSLSFRSYSNKEVRKKLNNEKLTVDRSLATVGASIEILKADAKALILNPYLYFGTEKDSTNTDNVNGAGLRLVGQAKLNKTIGFQAGIDANNMEGDFKSDIYVGLAFAL
ncbi:MAG: hypothetical protein ACXWRE_06475 [Pseudobdellovibrionaceae bacterium]